MLGAQNCAADGGAVGFSSLPEGTLAPPPAYEDICRFVAEYAGRLPCNAFTGTAPYEYTGCDYALVLYAIMPSNCIDLSRLCWSTTPLPAQLEANLAVFCDAARGLQLCDAPVSSLQPHRLACTPACIVHHIKVQHWLFVLSQRFRPEKSFDAVSIRMRLRHAQLGEPRLTTSAASHLTDTDAKKVSESDAFSFPSLHCPVLWKTPEIKPETDATRTTKTTQAVSKAVAGGSGPPEKPWKSAARPWRTGPDTKSSSHPPSRKPPASDSSAADCAVTASTTFKCLADQWSELERRRLQLKETLAHVRRTAQCTLFSNGKMDFDSIVSLLQPKQ